MVLQVGQQVLEEIVLLRAVQGDLLQLGLLQEVGMEVADKVQHL